MQDTSRFKNEDLVLKVTSNIDPSKFDITKYEAFLDSISPDREYQKQAVRTVCNYLFGGVYPNLRALAEENYLANGVLQEKYPTFKLFEREIELPDQVACSVDLATGTGKSYVIYTLARIALASGLVDRVLVLCPSTTIEAGLIDKFRLESKEKSHTDVLPDDSVIRNPEIIDGTETATVGTICVENIHATYSGSKSSLDASFKGKGDRTLVLCDEAHHIYSPDDAGLRKWKEFLMAPEYGFRYVVGFSGTCYVGNEYFTDVVARYSLKQATEEKVVKWVEYAVEDDGTGDANEKWQKIYSNHKEAKAKYKLVKPITIIVTKDISTCKRVADLLIDFLAATEGVEKEDAAKKVLRVHSKRASGAGAKEDKDIPLNLAILRSGEVEHKDNPVEWITSVSMLTEGWDVKNVFQIVPHEERAFNSKLLIAQVLGRGLRVPPAYATVQPVVTVFNHDKWSGSIRQLVNEVLERDRRVTATVVKKEPDYDFEIHNIDYEKAEDVVATTQVSEYNFDRESVNLAAQRKTLERQTVYERAVTVQRRTKKTRISIEMYDIEQVVLDIFNKFKSIDSESGSTYTKRYPKPKIRAMVRASLDNIGYDGNEVSKENKQRILSSFGNLQRPGNKSIRYRIEATSPVTMRATQRGSDSVGTAMIRRPTGGSSVFYDDRSKTYDPEVAQTITDLENDGSRPVWALTLIPNRFNFKTCLSVVLTTGSPERNFVTKLIAPENAAKLDAWLKNTDTGFYEIEYSYSRGDYSKRGVFNPDFFLCLSGGKDILVIEVKEDEQIKDPSSENKGKRKAAAAHFDLLNKLQSEKRYHFCFLTPLDYPLFFPDLREGKAMTFRSSLDVELMKP